MEIASAVGKPLKLDCESEIQSRPVFARLCVEMDVLVDRPHSIAIDI